MSVKMLKPRVPPARRRVKAMTDDPAAVAAARALNEPWRAWYYTPAWRRLRIAILARAGWRCEQTGVSLTGKYPARDSPIIDHIVAHKGDPDLFWSQNNLQAVSRHWHDTVKRSLERMSDNANPTASRPRALALKG